MKRPERRCAGQAGEIRQDGLSRDGENRTALAKADPVRRPGRLTGVVALVPPPDNLSGCDPREGQPEGSLKARTGVP